MTTDENVPAVPEEVLPALPDDAAIKDWAQLLVARARDEGVDLTGDGGLLTGLKRSMLTGESFFQNTFEAEKGPGTIGLAPGTPGDIRACEMQGNELFLEKGAYLASTPGVECDAKFDGLKGLFNEGFFVLRVTGKGTLFFNSYGDMEEIDVQGSYTLDNGYAVAWEPSLQYELTRSKND